ncbi:unnamed protein product, partial [Urochloa humidicola]
SGGRGRPNQCRRLQARSPCHAGLLPLCFKTGCSAAPHPILLQPASATNKFVSDPRAWSSSMASAAPPAAAGSGRRIVVAVDEGEESTYALTWCLANVVSPAGGDTLVLVHARRPRPVYAAMDSSGYMMASDVLASVERHAAAVSAAAIDKAKRLCADHPHVKVETLVESGDPRDVVCDAAEKLSPDLLVMGSHGYGFIQRAFLGSVSNHCAQNCKCPVLIVKRPKE